MTRRIVLASAAVVCLGILLCGAGSARGQSAAPRASHLQSLVNDAVAQLQLSYRHDAAERQARYEAIGRAIDAWKQSNRGAAENEILADWLRQSMRASMPASREPMPAAPVFGLPREAAAEEAPRPQAHVPSAAAHSGERDAADGVAGAAVADKSAKGDIAVEEGVTADGVIGEAGNTAGAARAAEAGGAPKLNPNSAGSDDRAVKQDAAREQPAPAALIPARETSVAAPVSPLDDDPFRDDPLPVDAEKR